MISIRDSLWNLREELGETERSGSLLAEGLRAAIAAIEAVTDRLYSRWQAERQNAR